MILAIVRVVALTIGEPRFTVMVLAILSTVRVEPAFPDILLVVTALKS